MHKRILSMFALAALAGLSSAQGQPLDDAEVTRLVELLRPAADEPWRTIPWKVSVLDAQATAAQQKKPIFIWAMDGHPLGCT